MSLFFEALSLALVLLPAAFSWWSGRRLLRKLDDPLFPELYFASTQRQAQVLGACVALGLFASHRLAVPKILLLLLTYAIASFPFRRVAFAETWSLGAYLSHSARFFLAFFGPISFLALLPGLVLTAWEQLGTEPAIAAAVLLGGASLAWQGLNARIFSELLCAVPLDLPWLTESFARVLSRARCPEPRVVRAGPAGGNWVNAFALPSLGTPRVVCSHSLLEALGPAEATAVFAHELGHLEHYDRKKQLLGLAVHLLLVVIAISVVFLLGLETPATGLWTWVWPVACLLLFQRVLRQNQTHEHESDLRALELGADPQALIDGLGKIHALTRMPGRWSARVETEMSHPSLVQRARAIREAAGMPPPAPAVRPDTGSEPADSLLLRAADSNTVVLLARDRLHWLEGVPDEAATRPTQALAAATDRHSTLFTEIRDLRIEPLRGGRWSLRATGAGGRVRQLLLRPEDTAAAKSWLRGVEPLLAATAPGQTEHSAAASFGAVLARIDAVLLMLLSLLSTAPGVLGLSALLTLIRPAQSNLAATGFLALFGAARSLPPPNELLAVDTDRLLICFSFFFLGGSLLHVARRRYLSKIQEPAWTRGLTFAFLGLAVAFSLAWGASRFLAPSPGLQLHFWARSLPVAFTAGLGLLAAACTLRGRRGRWIGGGTIALGLAGLVFLASPWFRTHGTLDPFATQGEPLDLRPLQLDLVGERELAGSVFELELSPGGRALAWNHPQASEDADDYDYGSSDPTRYQIEADGEIVAEVEGLDFEFLDDERFGLLTSSEEGVLLWVLEIGSDEEPAPAIVLPELDGPRLSFDGSDLWRISAWSEEDLSMIDLAGRLGDAEFERWNEEDPESMSTTTLLVSSAGQRLRLENDFGFEDSMVLGLFLGLSGSSGQTRLQLEDGNGWREVATTGLGIECVAARAPENAFYCLTTEEDDGTLWRLDPTSGDLLALGSIGTVATLMSANPDGRLFLEPFDHDGLLVDPRALTGGWIDLPPEHAADLSGPSLGELPETPGWMQGFLEAALDEFEPPITLDVDGSSVAMAVPVGDSTRILRFSISAP